MVVGYGQVTILGRYVGSGCGPGEFVRYTLDMDYLREEPRKLWAELAVFPVKLLPVQFL